MKSKADNMQVDVTFTEEQTTALENILAEREQDKKRIKELEEYIFKAPNLDEMTATKYATIQKDAYIKGRADEQQKAEQIIYENYIPKQKVEDEIENLKKMLKATMEGKLQKYTPGEILLKIDTLEEILEGEK